MFFPPLMFPKRKSVAGVICGSFCASVDEVFTAVGITWSSSRALSSRRDVGLYPSKKGLGLVTSDEMFLRRSPKVCCQYSLACSHKSFPLVDEELRAPNEKHPCVRVRVCAFVCRMRSLQLTLLCLETERSWLGRWKPEKEADPFNTTQFQ